MKLTTTAVSVGHEKFLAAEVFNAGPGDATRLVLSVDISHLDARRLVVAAPDCTKAAAVFTCDLGDLPANGRRALWGLVKLIPLGRSGTAGSVTVSVAGTQPDPHRSNNTSTGAIAVGGHGADFVTLGNDIHSHQFRTANLEWDMINMGDRTSGGVIFAVHLPDHVRFESHDPGCTYSANDRDATCMEGSRIPPGGTFATNSDAGINLIIDVPASSAVALTGGTVISGAGNSMPVSQPSAPPDLDSMAISAVGPTLHEVDTADNSYRFTVFVDGPTPSPTATPSPPQSSPPSASSAPTRSPSAAPGLPVTGKRTAAYTAIGAATTLTGMALIMLARRRKRECQR